MSWVWFFDLKNIVAGMENVPIGFNPDSCPVVGVLEDEEPGRILFPVMATGCAGEGMFVGVYV
jgi:hypothetical protein